MEKDGATRSHHSPQHSESRTSNYHEEETSRLASPRSQYSDTVRSDASPQLSLSSSLRSSPRPNTLPSSKRRSRDSRRSTLREIPNSVGINDPRTQNHVEYMNEVESPKSTGRSRCCSVRPTSANDTKDAFGPRLTPNRSSPVPQNSFYSDSTPEQTFVAYDAVENNECVEEPANDEEVDCESLFFRDGRRRIDMVLVYQEENLGVMTELESRRREQRRIFEQNLLSEGIQLELEAKDSSFDGKTNFLKLHIPWKIKVQYAEVMNLKLPTKRFITISVKAWDEEQAKNTRMSKYYEKWKRWKDWVNHLHCWNTSIYPKEPSFYECIDESDREERFVVKDRDTAYTPAQRSLIVMQILLRTKYDQTEKSGIRRLLADGTYEDCYCLHEGSYNKPASNGEILDRHLLYLIWARPSQWYKKQPLWLIRRYFGDKVALYFAWLGFYTKCLILPAIVGFFCFMYGLLSMNGQRNTPSHEICDMSKAGNITLCPMCDKACPYYKLGESCFYSKMTYLFDNPATVFFAIFMSFWATSFLELWKRRHAVLSWEWDLQNSETDEEPRPEFETSVKTFRINPVTREREAYLPGLVRAWRFMVTSSIVLCMICVVLLAVLGTIMYRISLVPVYYRSGYFRRHTKISTSMTAALVNLFIIMILTRIYHKIARWMTNYENPRTQTEYEDSFTFKIFLFEFVNFYSSLIYIAFFKGRFYVHPGDQSARTSAFHRIKTDVCDPAGCLSEVCIQLAIIMIGKQCFNNVLELFSPKFRNWWRKRSQVAATKNRGRPYTTWEEDYQLQDPGRLALFDEYLEMIVQYGFVTLFVAAFPLAPLFALLNNIGEIRLDAYKMVREARRPLAERVENIGAWYGILKGVTYAAVVSNAFVIAYTSDFIPRSVYSWVYSRDHTLTNYIDSSLSDFATSDFTEAMKSETTMTPPEVCQYRGYRTGPNDSEPYELSPQYWHIFAARLIFVVIFEHFVFALTGVMTYAIPEYPKSIATQLKRERLLALEAKYEKGLKGKDDEEEVMSVLRDSGMVKGVQNRTSWSRRLSRASDTLDAHVEIVSGDNNQNMKISGNTSIHN